MKQENKKCLVIGCGNKEYLKEGYVMYYTDWINKNIHNFKKWNLNNYPYPYDNKTFDYIICEYVFEHLIVKDKETEVWMKFFDEIARILRKGGELEFSVPHFSYPPAFQHSCQIGAEELFHIFSGNDSWMRSKFPSKFEIINIKITLRKIWKIFEGLVNISRRTQWFYEGYLAYIIRGEYVIMRLRKK